MLNIFTEGLDHPEGLAVDRSGNLWAGGEAGQIYKISPDGKEVVEIGSTGGFNLGLAFSPDGWLLICDCSGRKLWRYEPETNLLSVFAEASGGQPLGHMNFPVFDREGQLYVSESGTWGEQDGLVHRFTADGIGEPWLTGLHFANGLALNAEESILYVVQSTRNNVVCVPVNKNGMAGSTSVFVDNVEHVPDGLALDEEGNLYVSCYGDNRIWRVAPDGRKKLLLEDPTSTKINRATNVAFGGPHMRTLYIANLGGWHISKVELGVAGQTLAGGGCTAR